MVDAHSTAIITPSYAADYDRCALLCNSIDARVSGIADHYILVDNEDYPLFSKLAAPRRHIINERDILPDWLYVARSGFGPDARKLWLSTRTWPMRGWHVQQLRRIAIAAHIDHEALLYCDSDMFFVRPFDGQMLWQNNDLRLYRKPNGITVDMAEHGRWLKTAYRMCDFGNPVLPHADYINNLVSWRRQSVLDMCAHIETISGRDWVSTIGRNRTFSECMIYGCFVDHLPQEMARIWTAETALCLTYWNGDALDGNGLRKLVREMDDQQFAVGIQSFTNTDTDIVRRFLEEAA